MSDGFQRVLDHIRSIAGSEAEKGRLFERLMKAYFGQDPVYRDRFSDVWLWPEWATLRPGFDGNDTGIDLVAAERDGGYCAIQCKCYAPGTTIAKPHLDSFISAAAREPFTSLLVVDTGDEWGPNARKTIQGLKAPCTVLRFGDLASRPFDWPDLVHQAPERLAYRDEPFSLRRHQQDASHDVASGFTQHDRGKLIMACGTGKTFTALRIAEDTAGIGGRVLYLVPSISLFQQSMREWATQRAIRHRYIGICSDTRAGRNDEDASLEELEIPVTTDPAAILTGIEGRTTTGHDSRLLHLPLSRARRAGAGRRRATLRSHPLRRGAPNHRHRATRRQDLTVRARSRRGENPRDQAPLHDGDPAPLHRRRKSESEEP